MKNKKIKNVAALSLSFALAASTALAGNKIERKMYNPWEAEIGYSQVVALTATHDNLCKIL
jgi:hypothetical protein